MKDSNEKRDKFKRKKNKSFKLAFLFSVLLAAGIPALIFGAIYMSEYGWCLALFIGGILMTVLGFYGTPLAWVSYGNYPKMSRLISLVLSEYVYDVKELSAQMCLGEAETANLIRKCISNGYLVGFLLKDNKLVINQNIEQKREAYSVKCSFCGAALTINDNNLVCPYCGCIIKNQSDNKK